MCSGGVFKHYQLSVDLLNFTSAVVSSEPNLELNHSSSSDKGQLLLPGHPQVSFLLFHTSERNSLAYLYLGLSCNLLSSQISNKDNKIIFKCLNFLTQFKGLFRLIILLEQITTQEWEFGSFNGPMWFSIISLYPNTQSPKVQNRYSDEKFSREGEMPPK